MAQNDAYGEFSLVNGARNPLSGRFRDDRPQARIGLQHFDYRLRVSVQIQQTPTPGDGGSEVVKVVEHK